MVRWYDQHRTRCRMDHLGRDAAQSQSSYDAQSAAPNDQQRRLGIGGSGIEQQRRRIVEGGDRIRLAAYPSRQGDRTLLQDRLCMRDQLILDRRLAMGSRSPPLIAKIGLTCKCFFRERAHERCRSIEERCPADREIGGPHSVIGAVVADY